LENSNITIIEYNPKHNLAFYTLNTIWLKRYFYVEDYDNKVLSNPKDHIIDKGGHIFFAKLNSEIVGTFAFIKQNTFFELSKMAVDERYQGKKIGQQLMAFAIAFAKKQQWPSITLYSNTLLEPAINLYKKSRF
jgi:Predicted acetyltransferase